MERHEDDIKQPSIDDSFPDEFILALHHFVTPWFADFANYLAGGVLPNDLSYQQKKMFYMKSDNIYGRSLSFTKLGEMD